MQYIPIDISDGLLWHATHVLSSHIRIPVGLLADFEDQLGFVARHVKEFGKGPYLYGLLGNTFGNLDGSETRFVRSLRQQLDVEDEVLIDVTVLNKHSEPFKPVDMSQWGMGRKLFHAHGAARHLGLPAEQVFANLNHYIDIVPRYNDSVIPETTSIHMRARSNDKDKGKLFIRSRRYNWERLVTWLKKEKFKVRSKLIQTPGSYDIGVLALKKS
jgi:histidine-specific SAM-dependent methyltransferase